MKVNVVQNNILVLFKQWCFQKDTIQKIYFFVLHRRTKVIQVWNDMRSNK